MVLHNAPPPMIAEIQWLLIARLCYMRARPMICSLAMMSDRVCETHGGAAMDASLHARVSDDTSPLLDSCLDCGRTISDGPRSIRYPPRPWLSCASDHVPHSLSRGHASSASNLYSPPRPIRHRSPARRQSAHGELL
jgi:hypothetical protein